MPMISDDRDDSQCPSLVIGLGEVGRPLLAVLQRAHRVLGIDLPPQDVEAGVDLLHVCYPGEIDDFVGVTAAYAQRYRPEVVVIHSTVPVGTTRAVQARASIPTVHSPVRGKHARMERELLHYTKFVGATDPEAADRVQRDLERVGMRTRRLASPEATELAKLTETTYLGLLVAFAQDVDRMAREAGVSYEEVVSFYEEIAYLPATRFFPGIIGGHCVMPNIELLKRMHRSELLDAIEWSNELRKAES
jgi:UDP-N-acetyl-D-mannosaminuronate dehydrogenase